MKEIVEATRIYQAALEAHRVDPDDEIVWKELCNAGADLTVKLEINRLNKLLESQ